MHRILIVVDDGVSQDKYRDALEGAGYEVKTTASGARALRIVSDWAPDLAVVKGKLRSGSGSVLLRHIVELQPSTQTILLCASPDLHGDFASWLADALLMQGIDELELKETIKELLAFVPKPESTTSGQSGRRHAL